MELVEDEITKVFVDGIANGAFLNARQKQLKHHVIGQQNLRRGPTHAFTGALFFLAGVLPIRNGKVGAADSREIVGVSLEFIRLAVDQGVQWIDNNRCNSVAAWVGKKSAEDCPDVRQ